MWDKLKKDRGYTHPDSIPPSLSNVYAAAETAGVGEDAVTWATMQLDLFLAMSRQRTRFQGGANSLSMTDIQTYLKMNDIELHHLELENILRLDHIFMNNIREQVEEQYERAKKAQGA